MHPSDSTNKHSSIDVEMTKSSENVTSRNKSVSKGNVAKYNGVSLPADATQRRRMRNKLSAQVHRKRKQDALNTAREEVEECDAVISKLRVRLDDTRAKIALLQSTMDAIKLRFGDDAVHHILQQFNQQVGGPQYDMDIPIVRSVTSDSDNNNPSFSSSSDEESFGIAKEEAL
mmetsp:Transcript_24351/g.52192  ORF Transcript_24351/g.52192 Transcript_24351/m.52192 type:complete len:173 (-) Transcript_24351:331-849(-)